MPSVRIPYRPPHLPLDPVFHDLTSRLGSAAGLAALVLACVAVGGLGALAADGHAAFEVFASTSLGTPSSTGIVAGVLAAFAVMGVATWLVIRQTHRRPEARRHALAAFAGQLLAHGLLLAALHVPAAALAVAVVLAPVFAWTMTWFSAESRTAGVLLIPGLAWIGLVTAFTAGSTFGH